LHSCREFSLAERDDYIAFTVCDKVDPAAAGV